MVVTSAQLSDLASGLEGDPQLNTGDDQTMATEASSGATNASITTGQAPVPLGVPDQVSALAGSGLVFDNYWGAGFDPTSASGKAFIADVDAAENFFQSNCTNTCTLNMQFAEGSIAPGFSAINYYAPVTHVSFSTLVSDLQKIVSSADQQAAVNALLKMEAPGGRGDPTGGQGFSISAGMAQILGITSAQHASIDDSITLDSSASENWSFNTGSPSDGSDVIGALEHEMSEGALGRIGGLGLQNGQTNWGPMDLFRYTAAGVLDTNPKDLTKTYFSIDGTSIDTTYQFHNEYVPYATNPPTTGPDGADFGDWENTSGDPFGPGGGGIATTVSATDLAVMQVLGWTPPSNLTIDPKITLAQSSIEVDTSDTVKFTLTNTGAGNSPVTSAGIYLSTSSAISQADTLIGTLATPSVTYGGGTADESASFTLPGDIGPGTYYIHVIADYASTGLTNNVSTTTELAVTPKLYAFTGAAGSSDWNGVVTDQQTNAVLYSNWTDNAWSLAGLDLVIGGTGQSWQVFNTGPDHAYNNDVANSLQIAAGSSLTVQATTTIAAGVTNAGVLTEDGIMTIGAFLDNAGQASVGPDAVLQFAAGNFSLTGAGSLVLAGQYGVGNAILTGASQSAVTVLDNSSTISGAGVIGFDVNGGHLVLHNHGVVNATDDEEYLLIEPGTTAAINDIANDGAIEDTGAAGLIIWQANIVQTGAGVIEANGAGANVTFAAVTIDGGTLSTSGGGVIETGVYDGNTGLDSGVFQNLLDGSTSYGAVRNEGTFIERTFALHLRGTIDNIGTLQLGWANAVGTGSGQVIIDSGDVTLDGGGNVHLQDIGEYTYTNSISGSGPSTATTLYNRDNLIDGAGSIGSLVHVVNETAGTIAATDTSVNLVLMSDTQVENQGLIEAKTGAGLEIGNTTVLQESATTGQPATGVIQALGTGAHVDLSGATILGGTLNSTGGGVIQSVIGYDNWTFIDGSTSAGAVTNTGDIAMIGGMELTFKGSIVNKSNIDVGNGGAFQVGAGDVTLSGGGRVTLWTTDPSFTNAQSIRGDSATVLTTLHNVDNTIVGSGLIGGGDLLAIDNQAKASIVTQVSTASLTITSDAVGVAATTSVANAGTMGDVGGGGFILNGVTVTQSGAGVIEADGAGTHVDLTAATIEGGKLATSDGGVINSVGNVAVLDGGSPAGALTIAGTLNTDLYGLTLKGSIINSGSIFASGSTVSLGSDVTLSGGGKISMLVAGYTGDFQVAASTNAATLHNVDNEISGAFNFTGAAPLFLDNQTGGTIDASDSEVESTIVTGNTQTTVTNAGLIEATGMAGLQISGTLVDNTGGMLSVGDGSKLDLLNSQIDYGTIQTTGSGVVNITDSYTTLSAQDRSDGLALKANIVVADSQRLFMVGSIANDGTIKVGATGAATLFSGATLSGKGQIVLFDAAGSLLDGGVNNVDNTISGAGQIKATLQNQYAGVIDATDADNALIIETGLSVTNYGKLEAHGGDLIVDDAVTGSGSALISGGGGITFNADFQQYVTFQGAGELTLATAYAGIITGFVGGDSIDLESVAFDGGQPTLGADDVLTVTESGVSHSLQLDVNGSYGTFLASADASGLGTLITEAPCYCQGTRILTARGEVAVEDLRVGDLVVTASGGARPIVWIGQRALDIRRHAAPERVWPVRISAGAFGEGLPYRDLWVSPGHNIAAEGVLIPACMLINGISVAQVNVDHVTYFHVELDAHDIMLAEGLPAESYLDCGNRTDFINGGAFVVAHPDFQPKHWAETCLPLAKEGPVVVRTKGRLVERLQKQGCSLTSEAGAHIAADGEDIEAIRLSETRLAFFLPPGVDHIALRSKTFVPAHTMAESADTRELGLCVTRLQIDGEDLILDRDATLGPGWHEAERDDGAFSRRWTIGAVPLPAGSRVIILDLGGEGLYWREPRDNVVALFG